MNGSASVVRSNGRCMSSKLLAAYFFAAAASLPFRFDFFLKQKIQNKTVTAPFPCSPLAAGRAIAVAG
jgi:hypothetical protein